MLTIANVSSQQAKNYYEKENYYSKEAAQNNSEWRGRSASHFGLKGEIELEAYEALTDGMSPDRQQTLRQKHGNQDRAGVDLTFSAPKSVSLASLVGEQDQLEQAHRQAVRKVVDLVEANYATTRIKGQRTPTDNLTVAMWHHDTSRELDPHLHTHCVVMNATQGEDGKWRTLSNEAFYKNKILLGQIYRQELARACMEMGYEIEHHPKELFEIKGYTREQLEAFSKRHEQILNKVAEMGEQATTENKIWAWHQTRAKKNHELGRAEKLAYWQEEADLYNIQHPQPHSQSQLPTADVIAAELQTSIDQGIEHCSEHKAAFRSEEISKFVTAQPRPFGINELRSAIAQHPELIRTFDERLTTQKALARELATIKIMRKGKEQVSALTTPETVKQRLAEVRLTQGQQNAITLAATATDQYIAWQGVAGAGKTYALNQLRDIAQEKGYALKGFASSAKAVEVLETETGIISNTVASHLYSPTPETSQDKQIWIMDEAGLIGAREAHQFLKRAEAENARVLLVGDIQQLSPVEAGNPFRSLQQSGMTTAYLDQSLRQTPPDLQRIVKFTTLGKTEAAIAQLDQVGRIQEIPDSDDRAEQIAQDYTKLSSSQRKKTLIVAGTNQESSTITQKIREKLKTEGSLGTEVTATRLRTKNLSKVQSSLSPYYEKNDVIIPSRNYRGQGLEKGKAYYVMDIEKDWLKLRDISGNEITANPMKFRKSVYTQQSMTIAVGDKLKWTKNNKELNRRNGEEFEVSALEGDIAIIEGKDGKRDRFHLQEPLHINHALVSTTYASQGQTAENVLVAANNQTTNRENFYVAISRAKTGLQIYAEDKAQLREKAPVSQAQENPLELVPKKRPESHDDTESRSPQQSPERDGAAIGKRVATSLETNYQPAQPNRSSPRRTRTGPATELRETKQEGRSSGREAEPENRETTPTNPKPSSADQPRKSTHRAANQLQQLNQNADGFIEQIQFDNEAVGEQSQSTERTAQRSQLAEPATRAADQQLSENLDTFTQTNSSWEQQAQRGTESDEADQQRTRRADQQLSESLTALTRGSTNFKQESEQRTKRDWEAVRSTRYSFETLEQKSPQQVWEEYSQNIRAKSPVERTREVARHALRDGYSKDQVRMILTFDPHVQEVDQKQGREKAEKHIKTMIRAGEDRNKKARQPRPEQEQQRRQQRNDDLTL
ncbi:MAG: relaxase domain-containing protein [Cyanobacteria bacterium]|jgi:conjugative relaxase-like TrwC/TraI family protein|nr:relaxase domain-containing protein [Cyanobacteria bacterium GSL.Bin1]